MTCTQKQWVGNLSTDRKIVSLEHRVIFDPISGQNAQYTDVIWDRNGKRSSSRYHYHLTSAEVLRQAEIIEQQLLTSRN